MAVHPEVTTLLRRIGAQTEAVATLVDSLDDERLFRRPGEDRWSPAEHVAHLVPTTRAYTGEIRDALAGVEPVPSPPPAFKRGWLGQFLVRSMRPPPGNRIRTFRSLEPPAELDRDDVLRDFREVQDELATVLEEGDGIDWGRTRMKNPFIPLVRLRVIDGAEAIVTHTDRHHWLIREALGEVSAG